MLEPISFHSNLAEFQQKRSSLVRSLKIIEKRTFLDKTGICHVGNLEEEEWLYVNLMFDEIPDEHQLF